jgi:hypothetical protein
VTALRLDDARATALSTELRESDDLHMEQRRRAVGWLLVSAAAMGVVAAYQLGLLKHLPEPPLPRLDADRVTGSAAGYRLLATPDAVLGLGSFAATLGLVAMGGAGRTTAQPWIPLAAAAKATLDALQAARLTADQWAKHRAFCSWCLVAAGATVATLRAVLPEAREAGRFVATRGRADAEASSSSP